MDLEFSIVSDILFITKHKIDHNFGPNLNIENILSVLDSPYPYAPLIMTREYIVIYRHTNSTFIRD